jgi:hypothetical protein
MRITKKIFLIAMAACSFTLVLFDAETGGKKGGAAPILSRTEAETGG